MRRRKPAFIYKTLCKVDKYERSVFSFEILPDSSISSFKLAKLTVKRVLHKIELETLIFLFRETNMRDEFKHSKKKTKKTIVKKIWNAVCSILYCWIVVFYYCLNCDETDKVLKDTCLENQEIKKKIQNEKFSLRIQRACSMKCGQCVVCEGEGRGRVGGINTTADVLPSSIVGLLLRNFYLNDYTMKSIKYPWGELKRYTKYGYLSTDDGGLLTNLGGEMVDRCINEASADMCVQGWAEVNTHYSSIWRSEGKQTGRHNTIVTIIHCVHDCIRMYTLHIWYTEYMYTSNKTNTPT